MVKRGDDKTIDQRIVELRKQKWGLFRIHKWLSQWDNFSCLDEQIVLSHILGVLDDNHLAVSRNEVKYCFNQYYKREFHGDKRSYLNWMYKEFNIKSGTLVKKKRAHRHITDTKHLHQQEKTDQRGIIQ